MNPQNLQVEQELFLIKMCLKLLLPQFFSTGKLKELYHMLYSHCANKEDQTDSLKVSFGNRNRMEHNSNTAR